MTNRLWIVLFLLLVWLGFSNNFSISSIILGTIVAVSVNIFVVPKMDIKVNIFELSVLFGYVLVELVRSTAQVTQDILRKTPQNKPEIIHLEFKSASLYQLSLLSNLISLTPGTLTIQINEDQKTMVIHIMFSQDKQQFIDFIENKLEPRVLKVIQNA